MCVSGSFFSAFVRTWVRDQPCVVGARGPQVTVVDRRGKHTLLLFSVSTCSMYLFKRRLMCSKNTKAGFEDSQKFQNSKIGISSIIHRDDINVSAKLSAVNGKLKEMANNDDFVFIDNSRIDGTCLNGSKLHLNAKGSAYLANNFIKFIKPLGKQAKLQTGFLNPIHQLGQLLTQLTTQPMTIPLYKKPRR